ncbi:MAG TPA: hypothetical protein VFV34_06480, partial [Blastocatellia bacterium]|nr:hypothetical protein [Blastocatellia bacterium]
MTKPKSLTTTISFIVVVLTLAMSPTATTGRGTEGLRVAFCRVGTVSTHARQILDGPLMIKAFRIEFNNRVVGAVVVTGRDNPAPPPGYASGREYWSWTPGAAWPGTFTLVPVNTVPDYYSFSWETRSHEKFDLSRTVPIPSISIAHGDRFYRVQVRNDSRWVDQGWMWLDGDKRVQEWYGQNLTSDLLGDGTA